MIVAGIPVWVGVSGRNSARTAADLAQDLMEAAEWGSVAGPASSDVTALVRADGSLHLNIDAQLDWPLDSLVREHGAAAGYRVMRRAGVIEVEVRTETASYRMTRPIPSVNGALSGSRVPPPRENTTENPLLRLLAGAAA